jgi:UDP:flavonoid glycosyltransferase YjiC (YdhE family)
MTFGTVAADFSRGKHIYRVAEGALSDLPLHVLLSAGDNAPSDLLGELPRNVVVRRFVSQAEVLPHVQLLVCHGGSGTVLGGWRLQCRWLLRHSSRTNLKNGPTIVVHRADEQQEG